MKTLGISAFYHDSAITLIDDKQILFAGQEERWSRIKHDKRFPRLALLDCLQRQNIRLHELDSVCFYEKPFLKLERVIESHLRNAPFSFTNFVQSFDSWIHDKLFLKQKLLQELKKIDPLFDSEKLAWSEHHLSHAASAFFPSPFSEAAILTLDGVGELTTTCFSFGKLNQIEILKELHFPHSLGMFYSAFTYHCGFKVDSGEYKLMGLAPYGKPIYQDLIWKNLISQNEDASFQLNMNYFEFERGLSMTNAKFAKLFSCLARKPEDNMTQVHFDLAASAQAVLEKVILNLATELKMITGSKNLCLAGGVALNCVANSKIKAAGIFENIWVQPASGDAGGALGAALAAKHLLLEQPRSINPQDDMQGALLGPHSTETEIESTLKTKHIKYTKLTEAELIQTAASELAKGAAIGWHQGRMEFGPRALGSRSILADPRGAETQSRLNQKIKFRESFRPFAPVVLAEHAQNWFQNCSHSPYMLFTFQVQTAHLGKIQAVTHLDNSARVQTVDKKINPRLHQLLQEFEKLTACPMLVNTSFNVRGEPIVMNTEDSLHCFFGTNLDILFIENFMIRQGDNQEHLFHQHAQQFCLD